MTAKYATTCGSCGKPIRPGEEITSMPSGSRGKWAHGDCKAAAPDSHMVEVEGQDALELGVATPSESPLATAIRTPVLDKVVGTEVWTDGACSGNPGPGGWAWATTDGRQAWGSSPRTTNQRMEIQAALEAVTALEGPLVVVSDSTYVVNCFRDGWWKGWLARGWVNSAKKPVANRDLWEPLIELYRDRGDVTFRWVKGHSGDEMNDVVDQLAVLAGKEQSHS
jgi:ribonuclease HI